MPEFSLIALPGFLGMKEDWQMFSASCFGVESFLPIDVAVAPSLKDFAKTLNRTVDVSPPRILMGYSMGARLALHVLLDNPSLWQGAILISGHPGLITKKEREMRCKNDLEWANAFSNDPWDIVLSKWEGQETLHSSTHSFRRQEPEISRSFLIHCLTHYSLGRQEDLRTAIANLSMPILWLTGEKDEKFTALADSVHLQHEKSRKIVLQGGHRLPWENASSFKKVIYSFLKEV